MSFFLIKLFCTKHGKQFYPNRNKISIHNTLLKHFIKELMNKHLAVDQEIGQNRVYNECDCQMMTACSRSIPNNVKMYDDVFYIHDNLIM